MWQLATLWANLLSKHSATNSNAAHGGSFSWPKRMQQNVEANGALR